MAEIRCSLDWRGRFPRLIIDIETDLSESQVRELAHVLSRTAEAKLNCLGCGVESCEKGGGDGRGPGNRQTQH